MKNKSGGFTLIELLVYISILVVLVVTITTFVIFFIEINTKNRIDKRLSQGTYSAMNYMLYEIRRANSIYTPTSIFNVNDGQLSLKTSHNTPEGEEITYIDFYLDSNNKLYIKKEGYNPELLISEDFKVTNLEFDNLVSSSNSVLINLALEYDSPTYKYKDSYTLRSSGSIRK